MIVGGAVAAGGAIWARLALTARSLGAAALLIAIGFGIIALGGGLLKLARSRESNGKHSR